MKLENTVFLFHGVFMVYSVKLRELNTVWTRTLDCSLFPFQLSHTQTQTHTPYTLPPQPSDSIPKWYRRSGCCVSNPSPLLVLLRLSFALSTWKQYSWIKILLHIHELMMKERQQSLCLLVFGMINNLHPLHELLDSSYSFPSLWKSKSSQFTAGLKAILLSKQPNFIGLSPYLPWGSIFSDKEYHESKNENEWYLSTQQRLWLTEAGVLPASIIKRLQIWSHDVCFRIIYDQSIGAVGQLPFNK